MRKEIRLAVFILLALAAGCASLQVSGGTKASNLTTVVTDSFASKEVSPGTTWKVYLKASDPQGSIQKIVVVLDQPGVVPYPATHIRVKKEHRKELSGFIYLSTSNPQWPMNGVNLTMTVQIQDGSGKFTPPLVFPLALNTGAPQQPPPPGVFKEEELGSVPIVLKSGRTPR